MKKKTSYLDQLEFDPSLIDGVFKYISSIRVVILAVFAIVLFGLFSLFTLDRRLNPEVEIPIVSVSTILPGASPSEVESLVTEPLETAVGGAKGLDSISSTSQDGLSIITAQFVSSVKVEDATDEVRRLVDSVRDLPDETIDPSVRSFDFENIPVWEFVITSPNESTATLERIAQRIASEIESLPSVDRVQTSGIEDSEIAIQIDSEKIISYGLQPQQIQNAVSSRLQAVPGGITKTDATTFGVSLDQTVFSISDISEIPIGLKNGGAVPLGSIAEISLSPRDGQYQSWLQKGDEARRAIRFSVYKSAGRDLVKTQKAVEEKLTDFLKPYENSVEVTTLENVAEDIDSQFGELFSNFVSTILLVFLTLFVFLGIRQALLASLSIPLTFLVSFSVMSLTGQSLNFLTLFSLLLSLGLLLDDAIVIIASTTEYYQKGSFSPIEAGRLVWRDFIIPIWTTTLTTVWAFLPLLLATGIIGEFIQPIPVVVSSTLIASTAVAVLITLPLLVTLLHLKVPRRVIFSGYLIGILVLFGTIIFVTKSALFSIIGVGILFLILILTYRWRVIVQNRFNDLGAQKIDRIFRRLKSASKSGIVDMKPIRVRYQNLIRKILISTNRRWQIIGSILVFSVITYLLLPLGFVQNEFFPESDSEIIYISMEFPSGTTVVKTTQAVSEIAKEVTDQVPEHVFALVEIGLPAVNSGSGASGGTTSDSQARITLRVSPEEKRQRESSQIVDSLRNNFSSYPYATISISAPSSGPPAGSDITVKILGDELSQLSNIASDVESYLSDVPGVVNISRSIKPGSSKFVFNPDQSILVDKGVSQGELGFWIRTALSGYKLDEITLPGDDDATSIVLYINSTTPSPEELSAIPIVTQKGTYSLAEFGTFSLATRPTQITREDGERTLVVSAGVSGDVPAPEVNKELFNYLDTLKLPSGYSFATGGANEENQKSVQSILQAMLLSFILILGTMVIQLQSFRKALIVMFVIPLAVSGVFMIFAITGTPLSFPGLIGVLALFGIVVNNSIVLVDKVSQNTKAGLELIDAIVDAAGSRLQPIFFSSITTIIGLIPITLSDPIWEGLGGAIIAGLSVSGLMMLFFIPVLYFSWFKQEAILKS